MLTKDGLVHAKLLPSKDITINFTDEGIYKRVVPIVENAGKRWTRIKIALLLVMNRLKKNCLRWKFITVENIVRNQSHSNRRKKFVRLSLHMLAVSHNEDIDNIYKFLDFKSIRVTIEPIKKTKIDPSM